MKIDLADLIDIDSNNFFVTEAIFYQKTNILSLEIEGNTYNFTREDREKLYDYFSFVNLEINIIRKEESEQRVDNDFYEASNHIEKPIEGEEKEQANIPTEENVSEAELLIRQREKRIDDQIKSTIQNREEEKKEEIRVENINFGRKIKNDVINIKDIYGLKGVETALIGKV